MLICDLSFLVKKNNYNNILLKKPKKAGLSGQVYRGCFLKFSCFLNYWRLRLFFDEKLSDANLNFAALSALKNHEFWRKVDLFSPFVDRSTYLYTDTWKFFSMLLQTDTQTPVIRPDKRKESRVKITEARFYSSETFSNRSSYVIKHNFIEN